MLMVYVGLDSGFRGDETPQVQQPRVIGVLACPPFV